jgi:GNAT superfamily N-acetyltransferase
MRELYRAEANCQIIHDSIIRRELADPYLILKDGSVAGYGAVWNKHYVGQLMEFYLLPYYRGAAQPLFRALLDESQATHIEAQTNMPMMLTMLYDCAVNITVENILFEDTQTTNLICPGALFRRPAVGEPYKREPTGDWVLEADGAVVANGGFLCHYNPPYGDIYMGVGEPYRGKGYGSYLVQELKRVCYEAGRRPAARCDPGNVASRRTLQKAGLLPCGRLLTGDVSPASRDSTTLE